MNIIKIKDLNMPELDVYARLNENQLYRYREPETGIFIVESPNVILRALAAGYEPVSLLVEEGQEEKEAKEILGQIGEIPVYCAPFDVLTELIGFKLTRGLLCAMNRKKLVPAEELCKNKSRIVILENVMNPTNIGAIFRSAAALNMEAVVLTGGCSDPLYRRASRVSMGTVFQIPWTYFEKDTDYVAELKKYGYKTVSMALKEDSVSIDNEKLQAEEKLAIIMGTEGEGLADSTIQNSDYTVMIPMSHGVDSLNVAAASAVAFWELSKKRG